VINPLIFREYDIRGRVGEDLTSGTVVSIGKGFGTYAARRGGQVLMVGRDCRLSSPSFRDALVEGLLSAGMDVVDGGDLPHPPPVLFHPAVRGRRRGDGHGES